MNVAACLIAALMGAPGGPPEDYIEAITRPSKDRTHSFVIPGRIAEVLVQEGDAVTKGQLLVRQDDTVERQQLEQLKAQAEDKIRVKAAEATLAQKKVDLQKMEDARKVGAATALEVEHARLDVIIAELSQELAEFEHKQAQRKHDEAKLQVERMRLYSEIDGKVEKIHLREGESAESAADVIRVITIDPLWIDVPVPLARARQMKKGQTARVEFPDEEAAAGQAKIIHIASDADAASDTLTVRVEVGNPTARPAGEHVEVSFPTATGVATIASEAGKKGPQ